MKKTIYQIIIILVLILGMIGILLLTNENEKDINDYIPKINDNSFVLDEVDLDDCDVVQLSYQDFPYFEKTQKSSIYFESDETIFNFNIDNSIVKIGEKVCEGQKIGSLEDLDILSTINGVVIEVTEDTIIIKNYDKAHASFYYSLYESECFYIGDVLDVYKDNKLVTTAVITYIDYQTVIEDCVKITLDIDNSSQYFRNDTDILLVKQGYNCVNSLAIDGSLFYIYDDDYREINVCYDFICLKDSKLFKINLELGLAFNGYIEVKNVLYENKSFDIGDGKLYVAGDN